MITIDTRSIADLTRDLTSLSKRAVPFATRNFVNDAAFSVSREAKTVVKERMTLRNRWTLSSIRVDRAKRPGDHAMVGSIEQYMRDQEFGTTKTKRGKEGVRITTGWAAGQEGAKPRTKLARKPNAIRNVKLKNRKASGGTRRQRNFLAVKQAVETKQRYVFMDLGRRKGIFKVLGGRKKKNRLDGHRISGARIKMVHDLTRSSVRIPPTPWLGPSVDAVTPKFREMYAKRLIEQINRARLFRSR